MFTNWTQWLSLLWYVQVLFCCSFRLIIKYGRAGSCLSLVTEIKCPEKGSQPLFCSLFDCCCAVFEKVKEDYSDFVTGDVSFSSIWLNYRVTKMKLKKSLSMESWRSYVKGSSSNFVGRTNWYVNWFCILCLQAYLCSLLCPNIFVDDFQMYCCVNKRTEYMFCNQITWNSILPRILLKDLFAWTVRKFNVGDCPNLCL